MDFLEHPRGPEERRYVALQLAPPLLDELDGFVAEEPGETRLRAPSKIFVANAMLLLFSELRLKHKTRLYLHCSNDPRLRRRMKKMNNTE